MPLFANVRADLSKFAKKAYRDGFLEATVRGSIALQLRALRQKLGLSQAGFADRTGKKQSVISRLEDPEHGKASVQTLLDIARSCDVALVVKFVSYPEFLVQTSDMSPSGLQPETISESLASETLFPAPYAYERRWFHDIGQGDTAPPQTDRLLLTKRGSAQGPIEQRSRSELAELRH